MGEVSFRVNLPLSIEYEEGDLCQISTNVRKELLIEFCVFYITFSLVHTA